MQQPPPAPGTSPLGHPLPPSGLGRENAPPSWEEVCVDTPESARTEGIIFASTVGSSWWLFREGTALDTVIAEDKLPVEVKDIGLRGCT